MGIIANIHEAKTRFSQLLERAHAGEEVVIAKAGVPYARLVPILVSPARRPGALRGQITGDLEGPVGQDELEGWG